MMSFRNRFKGRELEILNYINEQGGDRYGYSTMEHFGAKDYISWRKYVDKIAEELDFKFVERSRSPLPNHYRPVDVRLIDALIRRVSLLKLQARLRTQIRKREEHIKELEQELIEAAENEAGDFMPEEVLI